MATIGNVVEQLYSQDVEKDMEIPSRVVKCDTISQVKWASADGQYRAIHFDRDYALGMGLSDCNVAGRFKVAVLAQMLIDWAGELGSLKKLSYQHRGMDIVGETIKFKGKITKSLKDEGEADVECEIWAENPKGEKTVVGMAIVTLPSRE